MNRAAGQGFGEREEQGDAQEIESGMKDDEGYQRVGDAEQPGDEPKQRRHDRQCRDGRHGIEQHVGDRHASLRRRPADGAHQDCHRGTDIGAHHETRGLGQFHHAAGQHRERDQHGRRAGLDDGREDQTGAGEDQWTQPGKEIQPRVIGQRLHAGFHQGEAQQEEAEGQGQTRCRQRPVRALQHQACEDGEPDQGKRGGFQIELETDQGHEPAGNGRSQVGSEHHADGVAQGEDACADEGQQQQHDQGAALQRRGGGDPDGHASKRGAGVSANEPLETAAGQALQRILQLVHAEQKKAQPGQDRTEIKCAVHGFR